jgi:MFS transporter, putative metabolite:H+ symporter
VAIETLARGKHAHSLAFWLGAIAVSAGVALHIPMYVRSASMNFHLAGMPFDAEMLFGMMLILAGTAASYYGLLPSSNQPPYGMAKAAATLEPGMTSEAGRLKWAHWQLLLVLTIAVAIDSMKPASLGFIVPGTAAEYGLSREVVALLPFCALSGLVIGSYVWGIIADRAGRRAAIVLAGIMFVGTAICGSMPQFELNLFMCFMMGMAAGGMLPITYALLAECIPTRHRGWSLVLVGAFGLVGGWFAASGAAALFEPHFGWRILWFFSAPTGLVLVLCNKLIPESPRFLLARGRVEEARELVERYDVRLSPQGWVDAEAPLPSSIDKAGALLFGRLRATTVTLNFVACAWGLVNFGILLWMPADLRARGYSVAGSNELLFYSSMLALPTTIFVAFLYSQWSTKWTLVLLAVLTALGLLGVSMFGSSIDAFHTHPLVVFSILMVGVNGIIGVLLPYATENYPVLVRGRATGLVSGSSKFGGLAANALTIAALIPNLAVAAAALIIPIAVSGSLVARYGEETRNRHLQ